MDARKDLHLQASDMKLASVKEKSDKSATHGQERSWGNISIRMGMSRWMRSHFCDRIYHNGIVFSIVTRMVPGSTFSGF